VIFDSSFLMAVSRTPTTWFEDIIDRIGKFDPVILACVKEELERLGSSPGSRSRLARVALELGATFQTAPCGRARVDDEIASAAQRMNAWVATTDGRLSSTLRTLRVGVIGLRSGRVFIPK